MTAGGRRLISGPVRRSANTRRLKRAGLSVTVLGQGSSGHQHGVALYRKVLNLDHRFDAMRQRAQMRLCLQLARPGSIIVADNVVRAGRVADRTSADPRVTGVRSFLEDIAADPELDGTAIQTVGSKGWDGFVLAIVRGAA
jgi:hypothetical protein